MRVLSKLSSSEPHPSPFPFPQFHPWHCLLPTPLCPSDNSFYIYQIYPTCHCFIDFSLFYHFIFRVLYSDVVFCVLEIGRLIFLATSLPFYHKHNMKSYVALSGRCHLCAHVFISTVWVGLVFFTCGWDQTQDLANAALAASSTSSLISIFKVSLVSTLWPTHLLFDAQGFGELLLVFLLLVVDGCHCTLVEIPCGSCTAKMVEVISTWPATPYPQEYSVNFWGNFRDSLHLGSILYSRSHLLAVLLSSPACCLAFYLLVLTILERWKFTLAISSPKGLTYTSRQGTPISLASLEHRGEAFKAHWACCQLASFPSKCALLPSKRVLE